VVRGKKKLSFRPCKFTKDEEKKVVAVSSPRRGEGGGSTTGPLSRQEGSYTIDAAKEKKG